MTSYRQYAYTAIGMQVCVKLTLQNMANLSIEIASYESALGPMDPMVSQIHTLSADVTYAQLNFHIENVNRPMMLKHAGSVIIVKRDALHKTLEDMQTKML